MAPIEQTTILVGGAIHLLEIDGATIRGTITFNKKYRWRFSASNLYDKQLPYRAIFKKFGERWMDCISLPIREVGYRERFPITKVLAEMLARAFNRSESAFDGQPLAIIQTPYIQQVEGSIVTMSILVLASSSTN